jgi:uncharacterized UPF0146 family protein
MSDKPNYKIAFGIYSIRFLNGIHDKCLDVSNARKTEANYMPVNCF